MSPKSKRNKGNNNHITRSKSKTRNEEQGASAAVSYPTASTSTEDVPLSSTCNEPVPLENINNTPGEEGNVVVSLELNFSSSTDPNLFHEQSSQQLSVMSSEVNTLLDAKGNPVHNANKSTSADVSDNREVSVQTDFPPEFQRWLTKDSPIMSMFEELKAIRVRLDKVDKIDSTTASLDQHFKDIEQRTSKLEESVTANTNAIEVIKGDAFSSTAKLEKSIQSNSGKIKDVSAQVASLQEMVELQGQAIAKLTTQKKELIKLNKDAKSELFKLNKDANSELAKQNQQFTAEVSKRNKNMVGEMNKLIQEQKQQANSLQNTTRKIEEKILKKTEEKIEEKLEEKVQSTTQKIEKKLLEKTEERIEEKLEEKVTNDGSFQKLKDKAFDNRYNIIISGLEEIPEKNIKDSVFELFKTLGEQKVSIVEAFRLGAPRNDPTYHRPIKVIFAYVGDRNKIWRKRRNIKTKEGASRIKIYADLPKELRDEMNILYRVTRAAARIEDYKTAKIRNYAVSLKGKEYGPNDLEKLPLPIRPSTISNPASETALVFFSKYSILSNHHPSPFTLQDANFQNMEHYLASKRATLSGQENLIDWASQATDPKKAKAILHSLRGNKSEEWDQQVEEVALNGLRAKFFQNKHLAAFLKGTGQRQLGEASSNPRWGIGMDLDSPDVLDTTKWDPQGNLLGRSLMKIRKELTSGSENQ